MEQYVRERITQLRLDKGVSEYQMSYDLGHSRGYVNNITSGKSLPSLGEFFSICEYFGITPTAFFDTEQNDPAGISKAMESLKNLDSDDLSLALRLISRLNGEKAGLL